MISSPEDDSAVAAVSSPTGEEDLAVLEPEDALPRAALEDLPDALQRACARAGWKALMPVQSLALPYVLARRDVMVQSRTGSGKTGSYLLPMLHQIDPERAGVQALVLTPTRELAVQVAREAAVLFAETGIRTVAVYGGVGYGRQREALRTGAQVVVGTPGRILDHLLHRTLTLEDLRLLVLDEADRMLSIGFYPDMKEVRRYLPRRHVPTSFFSATYPPHVQKLAGEFLRDPALLSLSRKNVHVAEVQHVYCLCNPMEKDRILVRLLEKEQPASAIIFCNTRANVHYITAVLQGFGYNADELSSDLSQSRREAVLTRLREGRVRFLVATDVAARGIDIPDLSHVFLYEPPEDQESYIHRAGRTGRAGAAGTVISLVDIMQQMELERIGSYYRIPLQRWEAPTEEDVAAVVSQRLLVLLEARYRGLTGLQRERVRRYMALARTLALDGEDDQGALLSMLLDDAYQQSLHTPAPLPRDGHASRADASAAQGGRGSGKTRRRSRRRRQRTSGGQTGENAPREA